MTKKILLIVSLMLLVSLAAFPLTAKAETRFNMMAADVELLKMKNETQGTANWQDPVSANSGDYIRFNVYYHCGTTDSAIPTQPAQNTIVRLNFPTTEQSSIAPNAIVSANNVTSATDNGIINASSSQKLVFDSTATWYKDNNQSVSNVTVQQGTGYVEVNLGSITCDSIDCYSNAGYVVLRARLTTNVSSTLYASLEAIPNSGTAPLNGVDLRSTATGTATGPITYRFDCTSDGIWDQAFISISDNPKTVIDACNYQNVGTYIAKVRIERGTASAAEATATVAVGSSGTQDLSIAKLGRNLSDNTAYGEITISDPGEVIEFRIFITATGSTTLNDMIVKDTLPANMSYYGSLKVDNVLTGGDILAGLNIGTLNPQQTKTITFQAVVAGTANFAFGTTTLVNTVSVYNTSISRTDTASVNVVKTQVLGATDVPTGILDSAKIAFIFSVMATILLTYFLLLKFYVSNKAYAFGVNDIISSAKEKIISLLPKEPIERAEERLAKIIEEIRKKEKNI